MILHGMMQEFFALVKTGKKGGFLKPGKLTKQRMLSTMTMG